MGWSIFYSFVLMSCVLVGWWCNREELVCYFVRYCDAFYTLCAPRTEVWGKYPSYAI